MRGKDPKSLLTTLNEPKPIVQWLNYLDCIQIVFSVEISVLAALFLTYNLWWKVFEAQMLAVLFWDAAAAADLEKVRPQLLSPILLASSEQHGFYNSDCVYLYKY